jgi:hypothetical protein
MAVFIVFGTLQIVSGLSLYEEDRPVSFPAGIRRIEVELEAGSVVLRGGPTDTVSGVRHASWGLRPPVIDEIVTGDTLRIRASCIPWMGHWCGVSYTLDTPRGVEVVAHSAVGRVTVEHVDGDVSASSDAAAVVLTDIGGRVAANASAGRIEATGLRGPVAVAESSAGSVTLAFVAPPTDVTARSTAGAVRVEVPDDGTAYRVDADASRSEASVGVPLDPLSAHRITASSSAGSVTVSTATR